MTKRARDQKDKELRRQQILAAALEAFNSQSFAEVKIAAIARRAGLAKGTVYLYFPTKETLFLQVLINELRTWFASIDHTIESYKKTLDAPRLAAMLATSLSERPAFMRLISILHSVLEQNIDVETARAFKRTLRDNLLAASTILEKRLPCLGKGQGVRLLLHINAIIVGLCQLASPSPIVREAISAPDLAMFRVDFGNELSFAIETLLQGLSTLPQK